MFCVYFFSNKQRQLHRSKTLPVIHSPYQCTDEDELPGCQHMVQGAMDNTQRWSNRSPDSSGMKVYNVTSLVIKSTLCGFIIFVGYQCWWVKGIQSDTNFLSAKIRQNQVFTKTLFSSIHKKLYSRKINRCTVVLNSRQQIFVSFQC